MAVVDTLQVVRPDGAVIALFHITEGMYFRYFHPAEVIEGDYGFAMKVRELTVAPLLTPEQAKIGIEYNEAAYIVMAVLSGDVPDEWTQAYEDIMSDYDRALEVLYGTHECRD
jgi:hypothetical protein